MERNDRIKVGFCVAYDWYYLAYSLPLVYDHADSICLSIDRDRISWSGKPYTWNEAGFRALLERLDVDHKIHILEDDFHRSELTPMANEVRQRNAIAAALGEGGWHIQFDSDEFMTDFGGFVSYLRSLHPRRKINVSCPIITFYKQTEEGFFYIKPEKFREIEFIQIATQWPHYEHGRRNGYFNIHARFPILHLSWARSSEEVREKLDNWGHSIDFDVEFYYRQWLDLTPDNYKNYKNIHHLHPPMWPRLDFVKADSVDVLIRQPGRSAQVPVSDLQLLAKNSIWLSRLRAVWKRIFRR